MNSNGKYPYSQASGDVPTDGPGTAPAEIPGTPSISKNKFIDARLVKWSPRAISTHDALGELVVNLGKEGITATLKKNNVPTGDGTGKSAQVWYVADASGNGVYCNPQGWPYTASVTPSAADNDFDYIINNDNSTENNVVNDTNIIDNSNNTMTIIDDNGEKITLNIDSLYWDDSTHSYTANTYNVVNNIYNYYTYNITYNITNTYINYIGSNAAYEQDEYKYYYELPDGRSSEDLTAEEVAGMSFQFADVVNYARSATDTSLRALYHFDGNTDDSGYFSTQTKFKWDGGASITYMDSASFGGALYLDETAHAFDIDLPSNLGSGDFSIQFRHYQASQPDTQSNINNSIAIGGVTVLKWDERSFYWNGSSSPCTTVPVGNWHEVALIRNNGTLYFYINGLKVASKADTTAYQGKFMFTLGATSRAYTMFDEFRTVNFAVAKAGAAYTCATVPYDTNLVLVLPDSEFPIADEYWEINQTIAPWYHVILDGSWGDLSLGSSASLTAMPCSVSIKNTVGSSGATDGGTFYPGYAAGGIYKTIPASTAFDLFSPYGSRYFVLSAVDDFGNVYSFPFFAYAWNEGDLSTCRLQNVETGLNTDAALSQSIVKTFPWGKMVIGTTRPGRYLQDVTFAVVPNGGTSIDLVYFEIVPGSVPNTGHEKVSCIYSSADIKPNTAAVQSSIPVNGYIVGGVRPTFPVRGDVWFPVEGRRISGCYIYDGSMWRTAGCRYYTGTRWIPIYAFDIHTLADCWDIADAGVDTSPPITSESGFWNWWKGQWMDFRKWMERVVVPVAPVDPDVTPTPTPTPPVEGECEHTYHAKDVTAATCTAKGSKLLICEKCGDTVTEETDHLGHDWIQIDDIADEVDEAGEVVTKGYALWECTRCKIQHKDYDRTGPPPEEGDSTITTSITKLFEKLGELGGKLVDWLFGMGTDAANALKDIGTYFEVKAKEASGFGGGFLLFLSAFFDIIPPEIMTCVSLALIFLVLGLFVRQVLLK